MINILSTLIRNVDYIYIYKNIAECIYIKQNIQDLHNFKSYTCYTLEMIGIIEKEKDKIAEKKFEVYSNAKQVSELMMAIKPYCQKAQRRLRRIHAR